MEENFNNTKQDNKQTDKGVHFILTHSYIVFLFSVILGVIFDIFMPFDLFVNYYFQIIGMALIVLGSMLAYWAQKTSGNYDENSLKYKNKSFFYRGPYKFTRNPTHFGLFMMTIGLGLIINSLFSVIFTVIVHFLTKKIFIKKQEKILEKKYGELYLDYKKRVRDWV